MKISKKWKFDSKYFYSAGLLSLAIILTGCSSLLEKIVKDPKIKLERVDVRETNLKGAHLAFILEIENPNDYEIKVDQVDYKVFLGEDFFAEAKTPKPVTIAANKNQQVELPLPIEYSKVLSGLKGLLLGEKVSYRIEGKVKLAFLGLDIPFHEKGQFDLNLP